MTLKSIHDQLLRSMDHPSPVQPPTPSLPLQEEEEEDAWDTDGFVIPSLGIEDSLIKEPDVPEVEEKPSYSDKVAKEEEKIYLGPHGAPPSQVKQQDVGGTGRKQRFKQKLRDAERKFTGTGRENKVENIRELVGSSKGSAAVSNSSAREWLDPHCHESEFERSH